MNQLTIQQTDINKTRDSFFSEAATLMNQLLRTINAGNQKIPTKK